jgi:hypothetical protein
VTTVATSTDRFDSAHPTLTTTNSFVVVVEVPVAQPQLSLDLVAGHVVLEWNCSPGSVFQVQYATGLALGEWADLGTPITATGSQCQFEDSSPLSVQARFYRVLLVPSK